LPTTHLATLIASHVAPPPTLYTLSLHDALPICSRQSRHSSRSSFTSRRCQQFFLCRFDKADDLLSLHRGKAGEKLVNGLAAFQIDRKSTRLNSSHEWISYAVFCLKKKKHNKKY